MSDNCGCIYVGDDGGPEFSRITMPVAIIVHNCTECGREILLGEQYERTKGKWDGGFFTFKTCADCLSIRNSFFCDTWVFGDVWRDMREHVFNLGGNIASKCLDRLTLAAKTAVVAMVDKAIEATDET